MLAITNVVLVFPDHYLPDATVLVEDGKILDYGKNLAVPAGAEVYDGNGKYLGPGLVDIHTHSDGTRWFFEQPEEASRFVLEHGVTSVLPALYFNLSKEDYVAAIGRINEARKNGKAPNIAGFYMEGPYLNPKFGCDRELNKWKGPIRKEDYLPILEAAGDDAKVYCVAPEREGILDFVKDVKAKNPAAVFTVAHSEATPEQIEEIIPYGLRIATHHTNATGNLAKYPECRGVCVDEEVWYRDEIFAELICDSRGIHVDPFMLRLVRKIKGGDKIILIADAFVADGPVPPGYEGVKDINFDNEGEIAGSKLTLDIACQNMLVHTGSSICDLFRYASTNPAKAAGLADAGQIKKGSLANLLLVDDRFQVVQTFFKGEKVL